MSLKAQELTQLWIQEKWFAEDSVSGSTRPNACKGFLGETSWMQEAEATKANARQGGRGRAASLIS
jgi:hypothetical protein